MTSAPETNTFCMVSARAAIDSGLDHITEQVEALEKAIIDNPGLVFDLARNLLESTCKTIIKHRDGTYDNSDGLPSLFRAASQMVPFLPPEVSEDASARESLVRTLNGMQTALHGICELRNAFGFTSHGSDGEKSPLGSVQAMLAAQSADAIIGFLYSAHIQTLSQGQSIALKYDNNSDFNDWIDGQCELINILASYSYKASDVLFNVDNEAYRDLMTEYEANTGDETETHPAEAVPAQEEASS